MKICRPISCTAATLSLLCLALSCTQTKPTKTQAPDAEPKLPGAFGAAPVQGPIPDITPPSKDAGEGVTGLKWTAPKDWAPETPDTGFRKAQYRLSGKAGDAQCVIFYFGPGQGGTTHANIVRWADQLGQANGEPGSKAMKTDNFGVANMPVETVEVTGIYSGGFMPGRPTPKEQPESMLLGAVVSGPDANWFFKLTGPEATVRAHKEAFMAMIRGIRPGS